MHNVHMDNTVLRIFLCGMCSGQFDRLGTTCPKGPVEIEITPTVYIKTVYQFPLCPAAMLAAMS